MSYQEFYTTNNSGKKWVDGKNLEKLQAQVIYHMYNSSSEAVSGNVIFAS